MTMNRIPTDQRPAVIERVRQLNAAGQRDSEISARLGYPKETIRNLRREGDIDAVPKGSGNWCGSFEEECPVCTLLVDVVRGVIEEHKGFLGRVGPGEVNGTPVQVVDTCPASGRMYARFVGARLVTA